MRYLRMLSNSMLAGALGAVYLAVLVLQLNPSVPLRPADLLALLRALALSYGVHLTASFYALIVLRQLLATEDISPGWISFSMLSWLAALTAGLAAWLTWMNLRTFYTVLEAETVGPMATGAAALTVCALIFLALALVPYTVGRRGHPAGAALFVAVVVASVAIPVWVRGPGAPKTLSARGLGVNIALTTARPTTRVAMILLDGASLDFISTAASEGRLPNFGKLLDGGAAMHLATLRPTQPGPVWTAVATGRLPASNGVRSAARYVATEGVEPIDLLPDYCFAHALVRFGFLAQLSHTSASLRVRPLWQILGNLGVSVGVVGWPLTHPAEPVHGYLVSDEFHRTGVAAIDIEQFPVIYPPTLFLAARSAAESTPAPSVLASRPAVSVTLPNGDNLAESDAMRVDRMYEQVADALGAPDRPGFSAVRLRGLDTIGHDFLRYAMPRAFGDVSEGERQRYGQVLMSAYTIVDATLGRAVAVMAPGDLLLVVSGFGMEPLTPGKRVLERLLGTPQSGTHEGAPDGFLLAYGTMVEPGRRPRASVLDIVPTVLYFYGFPLARDMDGYPRTDIFRKAITEARPMTFIPSYDR